jgi:hypothetical protein
MPIPTPAQRTTRTTADRPAQRTADQPAKRNANRPARTARLAVYSLCATVPLALLAGCSHGSARSAADGSGRTPTGAAQSAAASPSASAAVRYASLPDPCGAISPATVKSLVPGSSKPKGSAVESGQPRQRGGCSWSGLHGYQYRFLDTAFQRFDSVPGAPSADSQAATAFGAAVRTGTAGATAAKSTASTSPLPGVGDQATLITWDVTKDKAVYRTASVVVRSANAVVTVDYAGAGLEGDRKPTTSALRDSAERAAKEALAALR